MFIYIWLNYCGENRIERIPIAVENIRHLFYLASQIMDGDGFHLFLLSEGSRIDGDEYLSSVEDGSDLIVWTEEQLQKLLIYFELKRYLRPKNISYPLNIDYFIWRLAAFRVAAFSK